MPEIDDFFVINDVSQIDLNKVIEKYKYYKNSSIPDKYLKKHFGALLQDTDNNILFKKKEIIDSPLQEFWTLRFIDMAENNYSNLVINKYSPLDKNDLKEVVNICLRNNIISDTRNYLMKKGVYLYFIESLPGTRIDGAVYLTNYSTIAIGLTVRYERLDYLWFTLLHELSHLILHKDFLTSGIVSIENSQDEIEVEANRIAKEAIISPEEYRVCLPKKTRNSEDLKKYAKNNNIHPVLLAGLIRRDLNNYQIFNDVINNFKINRSDLYDGI
jgi:HTH-type transcriptional regulator/antitoxin HigA